MAQVTQERFYFDSLSAVLLFATALGGAYLPKYLNQKGGSATPHEAHSLAFHLGNMLSAGVMLSAGFCHLLADAHRALLFVGKRFPMSNFLAATGYIITLLADQIVQGITESQAAAEAASSRGADGEYKKLSMELSRAPNDLERPHSDSGSGAMPNGALHGSRLTPRKEDKDDGSKLPLLALPHAANGSSKEHPAQHRLSSGGTQDDCHAGVVALLGGRRKLSFATAVLLACALCIHSVLEGMALGAQTSMRQTEDIMIAILAHKGLAAYALGASIVESGTTSARFWTVISAFSLATPIGIFVGYGLSSSSNSKEGAALSALASGTFLYVAFMEVIPKELADSRHRALKMGAFLLGYGLMSMLAIWA